MAEIISESLSVSDKIDATETLEASKELNGVGTKREREEDEAEIDESKKAKVNDEDEKAKTVTLGPKEFDSAESMFNYFVNFLRDWSNNLDVNEYEHMVLLDLLKKGHSDADKKIGKGVRSFQIRFHQQFKSRCFFLIRVDGSSDDFSFRKCINNILPLPEHLKGGSSRAGGGRGGRGRFRN